jgi:WD40 repeat protein
MSNDEAKAELPAIDPAQSHLASQWKHARPLTACRFDPSGKYVFTGAEDNLVTRWELASGTATPMAGHESWVRALAFSLDGETIFTGGYDGRILAWETAAEKPEAFRQVAAHDGWVRALTVDPAGKQLASCGNDRLVKVWNASDGTLLHELAGHESHVYNVAFHPSDGSLVSCDLKGNLRQWDLASGKLSRELAAAALYKYDTQFRADVGGARSMSFARDGQHLAVGGITNVSNAFAGVGHPAVLLLNWETGAVAVQYEAKEKVNGVAWGIRQHVDGFWIGLGGGGGGGWLYFWRDAAANEFFKFKLPDTGRDLDLHCDGTHVAVAHADGHLRLYALHAKPE